MKLADIVFYAENPARSRFAIVALSEPAREWLGHRLEREMGANERALSLDEDFFPGMPRCVLHLTDDRFVALMAEAAALHFGTLDAGEAEAPTSYRVERHLEDEGWVSTGLGDSAGWTGAVDDVCEQVSSTFRSLGWTGRYRLVDEASGEVCREWMEVSNG